MIYVILLVLATVFALTGQIVESALMGLGLLISLLIPAWQSAYGGSHGSEVQDSE